MKKLPIPASDENFSEYEPRVKSSGKSSCCLIFLLILLGILSYFMLSASFMQSYKQDLFKTNDFWQRMQIRKLELRNKNCKKSSRIQTSNLLDLTQFMRFFNNQTQINYFLCFSSLYFTVKIEKYDVYRVKANETQFDLIENFYRYRSNNRCIEANDHSMLNYLLYLNFDLMSSIETKIHLCIIKNKNVNICDMVKEFSRNIDCTYNYWNGEHVIRLNPNIKLVIHEYEVKAKEKFYSWYFDDVENEKKLDIHAGETNPKASLNAGFSGRVFNTDYFDLPIHFFYTKRNRIDKYFNFINYLNASFKLPSEIINYFMIFYSKIWYL